MCEPTTLAIAGLAGTALSAYGAYSSSQAQKKSAQAVADQNYATTQAQNKAFDQRINAQTQRTSADQTSFLQQIADQQANAAQMRQSQASALKDQGSLLSAENQQAETLRANADAQSRQMLDQTSASSLQQSQADAKARAAALMDQTFSDPGSPNTTAPGGADEGSKGALTRRLSQAATNVRDFGSKIADVGSYNQPLQTIGQAVQGNQFGIMPAQEAGRLLQGGAGVRLLPTQLAYQGAAGTGSAMDQLLSSRGTGQRGINALASGNQIGIANLQQSDADTLAANKTKQAQADAEYAKSVGNVISGVGNLVSYGAGYYGGYNPLAKTDGIGALGVKYGVMPI
jgi:hypothetical protein